MENSKIKSRIYQASLEQTDNLSDQMILITAVDPTPDDYRDGRRVRYLLRATPELRESLFLGKWAVVYFRGQVEGKEFVMEEFVRQEEWK